jgi:hypothetical protein
VSSEYEKPENIHINDGGKKDVRGVKKKLKREHFQKMKERKKDRKNEEQSKVKQRKTFSQPFQK